MSGEPRHQAVALSHADPARPPRVVAKGYGITARAIVQRARESGVYVHDCEPLVDVLMGVDLDQHIPPSLYLAVAQLLTWLHALDTAAAGNSSMDERVKTQKLGTHP